MSRERTEESYDEGINKDGGKEFNGNKVWLPGEGRVAISSGAAPAARTDQVARRGR